MTKRLVIITGMHRSGTSALARILFDLGFDAGNNLMPPDNDNPMGYWEDWDVYRLNEAILSQLFLTWDKIEDFEKRSLNYFAKEIFNLFEEQAIHLINDKLDASEHVVIKDPRFSILMPFWGAVLQKIDVPVYFFHIFRNPLSVAGSLGKRNGLSFNNGLLLWYYYNVVFLSESQFPVKSFSYHQLLSNPKNILNDIVQTLQLSMFPKEDTEPTISIKSELDHHKVSGDELDYSDFPFPEIAGFWNLISTPSELKDACDIEIAPYRIKKLSKFFLAEKKQKFVSTIVCRDSANPSFLKTFQASAYPGKNTLEFDINDQNIICSDFNIYFFDHPCKVGYLKITLELPKGSITLVPDDGNYFIIQNDQYLFDENQPYLHFSLPESSVVKSISLEFTLSKLRDADFEMIISKHRIKHLEDIIEFDHRDPDNKILKLENAELKSKIADFEGQVLMQKSEIVTLKKKSLWLYTELNKLKSSLSWKITFPLRWIQQKVFRAINIFYIISTDLGASYRLLRREGLSVFLYRLRWYMRGKRLKENIESARHQSFKAIRQINTKQLPDCITAFPEINDPLVSIVIPAYNNIYYTCQCLLAINQNTSGSSFEIIIIDDNSTEDIAKISDFVKGVRIIRNQKNIGFLKSCNKAAKQARGKYICVLNNDTEVQSGWLDHLVNIMEDKQDVALVGPKLVYPDGRLQEAGGIVWNDASAWNFGKFDDPGKPDYNYLKDVDYISGACMLVRKSVWETLNGFDVQFAPAYFEDTDLAYSIRKLGFRVVYQPLSQVIHHEGISNGVDENEGIKKFQEVNRGKFLNKWKHELSVESSPNGDNVFFHRDRSLKMKHLLVIDHYVPHFDQDAGSRSTFSYLKLFLKMGYKVHFIGDNFFKHEPYTTILQQMGVEVIYGNYYQKYIREWFRDNGHYFDIVIAHRVHIAPKYFDLIKKYCRAKVAYIGHDLQYLGSQRKFELTHNKKFKKESEKFRKTESKIFNTVDTILPFSTFEAPIIQEMAPEKVVKTIPVYFFEDIPEKVPGFDERKDILFVGYFGHPPNPDAILWFVKEVFPNLKKQLPDVRINVVGSKPTDEVLALSSDSITVTGFVSDDELLKYYRKSKVAVLPLRFGAGVKGKLLESLYHQIPTVITSVAAEGVPEIENYSMIADGAGDFADRIHDLYNNRELWSTYSENGKKLIGKYYTEDAARLIMEAVFFER